jgi:hypothetical protein
MKAFSASLIVEPFLPTPIPLVLGLQHAGQANRRRLLASHARAGRTMLRRNGGINHYQKCQSHPQNRLAPAHGLLQ